MLRPVLIALAVLAGLGIVGTAAFFLWRAIGAAVVSALYKVLAAALVAFQFIVIVGVAFGLLYPLRELRVSVSLVSALLLVIFLHLSQARFRTGGYFDRLRVCALMGGYFAVLVSGGLYAWVRFGVMAGEQ